MFLSLIQIDDVANCDMLIFLNLSLFYLFIFLTYLNFLIPFILGQKNKENANKYEVLRTPEQP